MTDLVRIIYTDAPGRVMPEHKGKVFAVIGPFDSHLDKDDLQAAIEEVLRSYNLKAKPGLKEGLDHASQKGL